MPLIVSIFSFYFFGLNMRIMLRHYTFTMTLKVIKDSNKNFSEFIRVLPQTKDFHMLSEKPIVMHVFVEIPSGQF